ncbi:MAG: hypothetical protein ACFHU9_14355 [Fluviicola sp.]
MSNSAINKLIWLPENSKSITLDIRVGMGQSGTITFDVSGGPETVKQGSLRYTEINSDNLDGQKMNFNVVCTDVNKTNNSLQVTVTLSGVENDSPWTLSKRLDEGDSYQFFGTIKFAK